VTSLEEAATPMSEREEVDAHEMKKGKILWEQRDAMHIEEVTNRMRIVE
jgi:hypothetical protein